MATGTAVLDFGALPGKADTSIPVTGQGSIAAGSLVEAWIRPVATAEHSEDEHTFENMDVVAATIVAGTGFTIYGYVRNEPGQGSQDNRGNRIGGRSPVLYGTYNVAWAWI